MALTKAFRETVRARAQQDAGFRRALLTEAESALVQGDGTGARALLRDYINATLGFETLAQASGIAVKSLHRMFGAQGNPTLVNLARVLQILNEHEGIVPDVSVSP
ncbi:MAG: transcriptional regulator [Gammaproteobacteria bacterium]|nr:transcriptional regulator [Gammaproteobacteria bacterium]